MNIRVISKCPTDRPNVFLSHSSNDKAFVGRLAEMLKAFSLNVWYDEWEIAVGDSIVEKVFAGLDASDTLVIVLSEASVASRWVREELSVAVMRRLSEQSIRLMPVVIEDCEIPTSLKHIKYADFRTDEEKGIKQLLEAITPEQKLRSSLTELCRRFEAASNELRNTYPNDEASCTRLLLELHRLLESALGLRVELEFRPSARTVRDLNLFEKIDVLLEKGVDVRSETWNALVTFRSHAAHVAGHGTIFLQHLIEDLKRGNRRKDESEFSDVKVFEGAVDRLVQVMRGICFGSGPRYTDELNP